MSADVTDPADPAAPEQPRPPDSEHGPLLITTIARGEGITGVHTHVRQLRRYLERAGDPAELLTPHSWAHGPGGSRLRGLALVPLFGARVVLERVWGPANVWWYRTSHEVFLRRVLRRRLAREGACTVYAQCPVSARAALAARSGPHQRVVLAVHFRISQADEWADKGQIRRDGRVYRWIRQTEREVLPAVDGVVFVSAWAAAAVRSWLPEADRAPSSVIGNFVQDPGAQAGASADSRSGDLVSVGNLEPVKNHRYLVRVLAAARRTGHAYTLDVFGEGVERTRLLALADELGVADLVRLHGFRRDVQDRLPGYRAYVHASYSESSSLAIMEAMAAGLPVLSGGAGALVEIFEDPSEGRFWPLDDPEAAAGVLIDVMEAPSELARAGRAARRRFLRDYDAGVVAPRLLEFLTAPTVPNRSRVRDR
ncbi:glycosyltransferase family 4 protein [Intrasporangium sp. YIM S08009]|uniref:glycosyltransferase family 4 protein n=1 Tax=Intrasporangium zincisolvens TaxID=3080018 RepID=UPI002B052EC1|nr:glycosyltransferase family 4 protein [Intrasporangium sp. YIM S08009]